MKDLCRDLHQSENELTRRLPQEIVSMDLHIVRVAQKPHLKRVQNAGAPEVKLGVARASVIFCSVMGKGSFFSMKAAMHAVEQKVSSLGRARLIHRNDLRKTSLRPTSLPHSAHSKMLSVVSVNIICIYMAGFHSPFYLVRDSNRHRYQFALAQVRPLGRRMVPPQS